MDGHNDGSQVPLGQPGCRVLAHMPSARECWGAAPGKEERCPPRAKTFLPILQLHHQLSSLGDHFCVTRTTGDEEGQQANSCCRRNPHLFCFMPLQPRPHQLLDQLKVTIRSLDPQPPFLPITVFGGS